MRRQFSVVEVNAISRPFETNGPNPLRCFVDQMVGFPVHSISFLSLGFGTVLNFTSVVQHTGVGQ